MVGSDSTPLGAESPTIAADTRTWAEYVASHPNAGLEGIEFHPAADLFPMMSDPELDELSKDIAGPRGLQQPLVWLDGQPLDGRNRLAAISRISDKARREPLLQYALDARRGIQLTRLSAAEAEAAVISLNLHRRHLTVEQRREFVAARLTAHPERSDRAIAREAKVDHKTVALVRAKSEARGEIPHVASRTDTKGRRQPASKPLPLSDVSYKPLLSVPLPSSSKRPPSPTKGGVATTTKGLADVMIKLSTLLRVDPKGTLDELVRELGFAKTSIAVLPKDQRIILARGFLQTLGLTTDDLRPVT
jgi:hypothetical protein